LEITIPNDVDIASVIAIGAANDPFTGGGDLEIGEAMELAFSNPSGVEALRSLGITWNAVQTGIIL
jgi:hypothetical protein